MPLLLPRVAAAFLLVLMASGPALAQRTPETHRCSETLKRLDRSLDELSQRVARSKTAQLSSDQVSSTRVLAELMEMETLRAHLRCLGLNPKDERPK